VEEARDRLLLLDFEIQLSAQEDHRFLVWRGDVQLTQAPQPPQPHRRWGELGDSRGYTLSFCCRSVTKQNAVTASLFCKEGERP